MKCAGVCKPALFYVTLPVSEGKPEADCVNATFDTLQSSSKGAGAIGVIAGIILLCGFAWAFPLCSGFSQKDE
jgi:hypothetical protein